MGTQAEARGRRQAPAAGNAIPGGRRKASGRGGGHRAGCSPAGTRGSQQGSHSIKVPRQPGAVWVPAETSSPVGAENR